MREAVNILELNRVFEDSNGSSREMIEILCARIRFYQSVTNIDSIKDEVISLIHWVSDFMSTETYPLRVDVIKNQLWESIGL